MLTSTEIRSLRNELRVLRDRVDANFNQARNEALRSSGGESGGGISNAPLHLGDLGSQEFDAAVALGVAENEATLCHEIEDALERVRTGQFGTCEDCGRQIPKGRLKILPYARHCVPCARAIQGSVSV